MKTWNQLFVRHGWLLEEKGANKFDCKKETKENLAFLKRCLNEAKVEYSLESSELIIFDEPIDESDWIKVLDEPFRGRNGDYWCRPGIDEPEIQQFDTYIAGVIRQLNRLQFFTTMCCDGHGRRTPYICFDKKGNMELIVNLFYILGIPRVTYREHRTHFHMPIRVKRPELLDLAENLSLIQLDWLEKGVNYIEEQLFYNEIETLLSIPGVSGEESTIREVVKARLTPFIDYITEDHYGNLLAEKTYGKGRGPTILLNAHLDTVEAISENRSILKNGNRWTSSEGILGADDRAGVAVLLRFARYLNESNFQGKVKFIFTVEEEIGLVGAREVADHFLWGIDAAIVLDRRGKGDIVTSCGGIIPFCSPQYGEFFERVAQEAGLTGWACTAGGSSDTCIWASHGIESVNLSVGYGYEHTDDEYLDVHATYVTYTLLKAIFQRSKEFRRVLRETSNVDIAL